MKKSRFSEEQIIAILAEGEAGAATKDVCRRHGISTATFCNWTPRTTPIFCVMAAVRRAWRVAAA
jgi:hypothetical protein